MEWLHWLNWVCVSPSVLLAMIFYGAYCLGRAIDGGHAMAGQELREIRRDLGWTQARLVDHL